MQDMIRSPAHRLDDLRHDRHQRHRLATTLFRSTLTTEFYATNHASVREAMLQAEREHRTYAALLGETMPAHLTAAVRLEHDLWLYFHGLLHIDAVPEQEYERFCARIRPVARALDDLLALEEEMLTNPLVTFYENTIKELRTIARTALATAAKR